MKFKRARADAEGWETISNQVQFEDPHLAVAHLEVRIPGRPKMRRWTVVHRKAAVVIASMTATGKLVLIRQERVPIRAAIWEVPAGQVDDAEEIDTSARAGIALRELQEETGYVLREGGELIALGHYFSSPGFTDEQGYLFLARPVEPGADGPAHTETESILDCRAFSSAEIASMIASGEIRDANTLSICAKLAARGFLSLHA